MFSAAELQAAVAARKKKNEVTAGDVNIVKNEEVAYYASNDATDSDDEMESYDNYKSNVVEVEPIIDANLGLNIVIPMERTSSIRTDATRTDGSEFYTPLETVGTPPRDEDDGDSTGTISTTESFPELSPRNLEMEKLQHMMETLSVKLAEHLNPTGELPPSATASLSHRRRRKTRSLIQSRAPSRGSLTPPVNTLPRCPSFGIEEATSIWSPVRHIVPSESFGLASAGRNSEDLFWTKLPEEMSPNHDVGLTAGLVSPATGAKEINQSNVEKTPHEVSSAGVALDAALMQMSALPDLELSYLSCNTSKDFGNSTDVDSAKLRWMQLLARWRHQQMASAMISWPTSRHFSEVEENFKTSSALLGDNISGFPTAVMADEDISLLSPYLTNLGPIPCCCVAETSDGSIPNEDLAGTERVPRGLEGRQHRWDWQQDARHIFIQEIRQELRCDQSRTASNFARDLSDLIAASEECLPEFESLLQSISDFAVPNPSFTLWAACVKSPERVLAKASIKYKGDVTLVKDILRGSIILPDYSSLVCALLALYKRSRHKEITIVRLKNLFRASRLGTLVPSNLPTGYRHVLVNMRLKNGLLAGESFTFV